MLSLSMLTTPLPSTYLHQCGHRQWTHGGEDNRSPIFPRNICPLSSMTQDWEEHLNISTGGKRRHDQKALTVLQGNDLRSPQKRGTATSAVLQKGKGDCPGCQWWGTQVKDACHHHPTHKCWRLKTTVWLKLGWVINDMWAHACSAVGC